MSPEGGHASSQISPEPLILVSGTRGCIVLCVSDTTQATERKPLLLVSPHLGRVSHSRAISTPM